MKTLNLHGKPALLDILTTQTQVGGKGAGCPGNAFAGTAFAGIGV
jgi:hypothetical protein